MGGSKFNRLLATGLLIPGLVLLGLISNVRYFTNLRLQENVEIAVCLALTIYTARVLLRAVYTTWIGPFLGHGIDLKSIGSWAIITGASDGIGKAYAKELAKRGINLVLISRSEDKLLKVAGELESTYSIETEVIAVDFTEGLEIYDEIRMRLKVLDLDIGTLINNVGMGYVAPEYFHELPNDKFCMDIINCNILSATMMTRLVLPSMIGKGKGVIVNVGSVTSTFPVPFMTLYGATKSYLEKFTEDMSLEYSPKGIFFQYLYPSYVVSNLSKVKKSSWHIPNPDDFVAVAVRTIGLQAKTAAWLPHRILSFGIKCCLIIRPQSMRKISYEALRQVWLYGKKIQMLKLQRLSTAATTPN